MDDCASLDLLIRPHLHIGLNDCSFLDRRVISDHRALEHNRFALDAGRRSDKRPSQFGSLPNVRIIPDDAAINLRTFVNNGVMANGTRTMNDRARFDSTVMGKVDWP